MVLTFPLIGWEFCATKQLQGKVKQNRRRLEWLPTLICKLLNTISYVHQNIIINNHSEKMTAAIKEENNKENDSKSS